MVSGGDWSHWYLVAGPALLPSRRRESRRGIRWWVAEEVRVRVVGSAEASLGQEVKGQAFFFIAAPISSRLLIKALFWISLLYHLYPSLARSPLSSQCSHTPHTFCSSLLDVSSRHTCGPAGGYSVASASVPSILSV